MGKQHNTFPNEQPEMPARERAPEVKQPADPKEPEFPEEDPENTPEEFPQKDHPTEEPPARPDLMDK
jgi:hypothetical protein